MIYAISGLILTGAGLSLLGEAIIYKYSEKAFVEWFTMGTIALVVFNSGLSLAIYSLKFIEH